MCVGVWVSMLNLQSINRATVKYYSINFLIIFRENNSLILMYSMSINEDYTSIYKIGGVKAM